MTNLFRTPPTVSIGHTELQSRFDAERDTPELLNAVAAQCPEICQIMASLRCSVPLASYSRAGVNGAFLRLPNHYRSVCVVSGDDADTDVRGVIVFKGTEPLLPDFPEYCDWMLRAPFRGSDLPLGLHFALDTKLPPGAMWIEECVLEQQVTSEIQGKYLLQYGRLARLPVPLFVFELKAEQVERYREVVRQRLSPAAFGRIEAKVSDGLGVEVYFYPTPPVRAADLLLANVRKGFTSMLTDEALEATFNEWIRLMADLLVLGYMPYAPWNHGMGGCVDPGNACIDGGFNDLLTIVPFDSIPSEHLFWRGLGNSIQMLAGSVVTMCSVAAATGRTSMPEPPATAVTYVMEGLREEIRSQQGTARPLDSRLVRFFQRPSLEDVFRHVRETQRDRSAVQFGWPQPSMSAQAASASAMESRWQTRETMSA